jgi:predicted  nucleic acid-binding Zn-ribbon protein
MNITTKNRWQVRLIAAIIFALGFTTGMLAMNLYRSLARNVTPRDRFEQVSERLQLNADQKTKVQQIFSDTRDQLRALRKESEPKVADIRRQADEKLQQVLTPEQWKKFQAMKDEVRQRRGRDGTDRD